MAIISPVQPELVHIQALESFGAPAGIPVHMLRLDCLHPFISGNKWYKLQYNLEAALASGAGTVLTFGGAYSNHLVATAAAAAANALASVGLVRGWHAVDNPVLDLCRSLGMQLVAVSREEYARKEAPGYLQALAARFEDAYIIPEGGANEAGRLGAGRIADLVTPDYTHIVLSVGSGTTFTGLRNALDPAQQVLGFVPMKGGAYLEDTIAPLLLPGQDRNWSLTDRFNFGGFGKLNTELRVFMQDFEQVYGFPLDRVYTGKMMFGLQQLLAEAAFPEGAKILCIHSGGLTGN